MSASFCANGDGGDTGSTGSSSRHAGKLRPTSAENCECQCNKDYPTFREDERTCVNDLPGKFIFQSKQNFFYFFFMGRKMYPNSIFIMIFVIWNEIYLDCMMI